MPEETQQGPEPNKLHEKLASLKNHRAALMAEQNVLHDKYASEMNPYSRDSIMLEIQSNQAKVKDATDEIIKLENDLLMEDLIKPVESDLTPIHTVKIDSNDAYWGTATYKDLKFHWHNAKLTGPKNPSVPSSKIKAMRADYKLLHTKIADCETAIASTKFALEIAVLNAKEKADLNQKIADNTAIATQLQKSVSKIIQWASEHNVSLDAPDEGPSIPASLYDPFSPPSPNSTAGIYATYKPKLFPSKPKPEIKEYPDEASFTRYGSFGGRSYFRGKYKWYMLSSGIKAQAGDVFIRPYDESLENEEGEHIEDDPWEWNPDKAPKIAGEDKRMGQSCEDLWSNGWDEHYRLFRPTDNAPCKRGLHPYHSAPLPLP